MTQGTVKSIIKNYLKSYLKEIDEIKVEVIKTSLLNDETLTEKENE